MLKAEFLKQIKEAVIQQRKFAQQLQQLNDRQLKFVLDEGKWSVAELLDHISNTNNQYLKKIEEAIAKSPKKLSKDHPKFKSGLIGRLFAALVGPQSPRRLRSYYKFLPGNVENMKSADVVQKFIRSSNRLNELIESLKDKNINKLRVKSPSKWWLRFRLGDALQVMIAHQARHLMQAKDILESPRFPKQSGIQNFNHMGNRQTR